MSKDQLSLTDGTVEGITALAKAGEFSLEAFFGQGLHEMEDAVWDEFEDVDDMEAVKPRLPQIGIAHSAQMFKMPDESKTESLTGIILDNNPCNAWWEIGFDESGGGTPPDCFSLDGIRPEESCPHKQADNCLVCPMNQFGSDGRGKACKNMRRLHLLIPGTALPYRLTLSPANLKPFNEFITMDVRGKRLKLLALLTELSLHPAKNQDGIEYSEVQFRIVKDDLGKPVILAKTREQAKALKQFREEWLEAMRGQEILADEQHAQQMEFEGDIESPEEYGSNPYITEEDPL